jgi:hypothetical protein
VLYDLSRDRASPGERVLERVSAPDRELGAGAPRQHSAEAQFVFYLIHEAYGEKADWCFSDYTAGLGQMTFGGDRRQRADAAVFYSPEALGHGGRPGLRAVDFHNLHGAVFHLPASYAGHLLDCPQAGGPEVLFRRFQAARAAGAVVVGPVAGAAAAAVAAAAAAVPAPGYEEGLAGGDGDYGSESDAETESDGEAAVSCDDAEDEGDSPDDEDAGAEGEVRKERCSHVHSTPDGIKRDPSSADWDDLESELDRMKVRYAEAMTAVFPERLRVEYHATSLCDFAHRDVVRLPTLFRSAGFSGGHVGRFDLGKRNVMEYLNERLERRRQERPPWNASGRIPARSMSEEWLVGRIMARDPDYEGFVVICGGEEKAEDLLPGQMGFCMQRCKIPRVGSFTEWQGEELEERSGGAYRDVVENMREKEYTLTRTSFHERGETISTSYLRFLIAERKLEGFKIRHFVQYPLRAYLSPFVEGVLQRRWDITRRQKERAAAGGGEEGDGDDDQLMSACLKLIGNGLYGFAAIQPTNFCKIRLVSEGYLKTLRGARRAGRMGKADENIFRYTLMGAFPKKDSYDMLYSLTCANPNAKIRNILQMSATILSNSRVVFLGRTLELLRLLDPSKVELMYMVSVNRKLFSIFSEVDIISPWRSGHGLDHHRHLVAVPPGPGQARHQPGDRPAEAGRDLRGPRGRRGAERQVQVRGRVQELPGKVRQGLRPDAPHRAEGVHHAAAAATRGRGTRGRGGKARDQGQGKGKGRHRRRRRGTVSELEQGSPAQAGQEGPLRTRPSAKRRRGVGG